MKPLTEPMLNVLISIATPDASWRWWYPAGQRRLILQALFNRELVDATDPGARLFLTAKGLGVLELIATAEVVDVDG